jgi:exodeoxyribonuclease VII large subunit
MTEPLDLFDREPDPEPEVDSPRVWDVSDLNAAVRALLEETLPTLWIRGEVTNWTRARSGHCYFTLKDERAQIRCVMWRSRASRLPMDPDEGMTLRILGSVTLYERRGEFQFTAEEVQAEGEEGLWKLAFEKLRARLEGEGLLAAERKRPIPRFPTTIGVVTSTTGAALRDILSVLKRRAPWSRVIIRGARVQGEGASEEIARAIGALGRVEGLDLMIVGRGGGSIEDLWAFNEEPVARAIAMAPVPVISAVGHETDVTISDLVADLRAPTPSAAAEAAVPDAAALLEFLERAAPRLARGLREQVDRRRRALSDRIARLGGGLRSLLLPLRAGVARRGDRMGPAVRRLLEPAGRRITTGGERLERAMTALLSDRRHQMARAAAGIEALSPLSTLRRGYAVPLDPDGRVLRASDDFRVDEAFVLRIVDGRVHCRVEDIEPEPDDEVIP